MAEIDIEKVRELVEKATPGPWRWEINLKHKSVQLCGGDPKAGFGRYDLTVMSFERWGMSGATVRFRDERNIMRPAKDFAAEAPGRAHHADWFRLLSHPDANLAELAPDLARLAITLTDRVKELEKEIACDDEELAQWEEDYAKEAAAHTAAESSLAALKGKMAEIREIASEKYDPKTSSEDVALLFMSALQRIATLSTPDQKTNG